jgi:ribulose kinase
MQTKAKPRVARKAKASSDGEAEDEGKQRWIYTGRWETLPARSYFNKLHPHLLLKEARSLSSTVKFLKLN